MTLTDPDFPDRYATDRSVPTVPVATPHCAGRVAVAHERTAMVRVRRGWRRVWRCNVCGEEGA